MIARKFDLVNRLADAVERIETGNWTGQEEMSEAFESLEDELERRLKSPKYDFLNKIEKEYLTWILNDKICRFVCKNFN